MSVEQAAYDALCHALALRAEEMAELRAENERLRGRGTAAMTTYKLCGCEDERTGQIDTWITRDGEHMSSEEIVQTLTEQEAEIERLRAALFCKRCDGTGQWFCGVADTWLDCDDCEANAIRREAARAAGGEA